MHFNDRLSNECGAKECPNGIKKWPHVIPARSKNGFGMEANCKMPKNPTRADHLFHPKFDLVQNAFKNMSFSQSIISKE